MIDRFAKWLRAFDWQPHRSLGELSSLPIRQRDLAWFRFREATEENLWHWGLWASVVCTLGVFAGLGVPAAILCLWIFGTSILGLLVLGVVSLLIGKAAAWTYTRTLSRFRLSLLLQHLPGHCPYCGCCLRAGSDTRLLVRCPGCEGGAEGEN
jgi:hypothetical protein